MFTLPDRIERIWGSELREMIHLLGSEVFEPEDRPTLYALVLGVDIIEKNISSEILLPIPNVCAWEGGLRIEWPEFVNRSLRLIVPANNQRKEYLYFQTNENTEPHYNIEDVKNLQKMLWWYYNPIEIELLYEIKNMLREDIQRVFERSRHADSLYLNGRHPRVMKYFLEKGVEMECDMHGYNLMESTF